MIRALMGDIAYWEKWANFNLENICKDLEQITRPSGNPEYRPQFVFDIAIENCRLLLRRYSRGDSIHELSQHFPGLLDAWELSNQLAAEVCREHSVSTCRDWDFRLSNLNHYNWCFWLVGLGLALEIPDVQWQRLIALIGDEGEDILLDRIIVQRQTGRRIGPALLHPKPYARLLKAIEAPAEQQAGLLQEFVAHWYAELKRPAPRNRKAPTIEPYWYIYGDPEKHPLEMGSYFGRWCIEAVGAVKAFGLDDSLCLGHEHYPGDLLRPDGPSTHPPRAEVAPKPGFLARLFGKAKR